MAGFQYGARSIWERRPESIDALRELATSGISGSLIAEELNKRFGSNLSRRAVCGKAWKLGIVIGGGVDDKGKSARLGLAVPRKKAPKKVKPIRSVFPIAIAPEDTAETTQIAIPTTARVRLLELTAKNCRWPIGDPRDESFGFCGCDGADMLSDPVKPYCAAHASIAFCPSKWKTSLKARRSVNSLRAGVQD